MKIAVFGSAAGNIDCNAKDLSREVGRQIALQGHVIITGACTGLPYEAVLEATEKKGTSIGFSPALNEEEHKTVFKLPTEGFSKIIYITESFPFKENKKACYKYRNVLTVAKSDAAIIIGGRCGTLNEFTLAYDLGKSIGVLIGTSGVTKFIKDLIRDFDKPTGAQVVYENNPAKLIDALEKITAHPKP